MLPFLINVMDKKQTLIEKLVSLIRFFFDKDAVTSLTGKICHFYDLYFLYHMIKIANLLLILMISRRFFITSGIMIRISLMNRIVGKAKIRPIQFWQLISNQFGQSENDLYYRTICSGLYRDPA